MLKKFSLLPILILLLFGSFKNSDTEFEKAISFCKQNPKEFLAPGAQKKFEAYSDIEQSYLKMVALESLGQYAVVDSSIKSIFKTNNFKEDSSLYFRFLLTLIDQQKITNDFESASKNLYSTLSYAQRTGNKRMEINTKIALGELFRAMENFEFGLNYLKEAQEDIKDLEKEESQSFLARIYNRRAAILLQEGIYLDSVESLSLKAIAIAKSIGDLDLEAVSSNELGYLYLNLDNANAEKYLKRAISNWESMSYRVYAANARLNLARHY